MFLQCTSLVCFYSAKLEHQWITALIHCDLYLMEYMQTENHVFYNFFNLIIYSFHQLEQL